MTLKAGDILGGRFEIRDQISVGTFGIVYLALERELNRPVAIKELMAADAALDNRDYLKQKRRFDLQQKYRPRSRPGCVLLFQRRHRLQYAHPGNFMILS